MKIINSNLDLVKNKFVSYIKNLLKFLNKKKEILL